MPFRFFAFAFSLSSFPPSSDNFCRKNLANVSDGMVSLSPRLCSTLIARAVRYCDERIQRLKNFIRSRRTSRNYKLTIRRAGDAQKKPKSDGKIKFNELKFVCKSSAGPNQRGKDNKNASLHPKNGRKSGRETTLAIYSFTSSLNTFIRLKCSRQKVIIIFHDAR